MSFINLHFAPHPGPLSSTKKLGKLDLLSRTPSSDRYEEKWKKAPGVDRWVLPNARAVVEFQDKSIRKPQIHIAIVWLNYLGIPGTIEDVMAWFPWIAAKGYRISSYSFHGNYPFLNLEIQRSQYIMPKVTVHKCAETIQGRKLFKGGNYMRKYGNCILKGQNFTILH